MKLSRILVSFVMLALPVGDVLGQQVLAPPPVDFSGMSPALRTMGTNQPGAMPLPPETPQEEKPLLQLGPAVFRPHLMYRFIYGDGVPAEPGEQTKTAINEIYPGMLIELGEQWRLDYTPVLRYYSSSRFRDTLDHSVNLTWGGVYGDWLFGFRQSYISSSQPLIETGGQTDTETYATGLNATRQLNSALSLELGVNQAFRFTGENTAGQQLTDSKTWSTLNWLNYQFSSQFGAAVGVGFAYDDLSAGTDMTSEQLQGRFTWRPGEKLFVSLSGGFEDRQFLDSDQSDALNPLFGLSALYQIFEPTTLSLGASRTVGTSYFQNQITENLTLSAGLRQRLLNRLFLDLTGGYHQTSYQASTSLLSVNREDDGIFFNARLSMQVLRRGTVAVFYNHTENTSSDREFELSSEQVGVELGYRF